MRKKLRSHLTFANVVSVIALFVALGGTGAYAANEWTGANIVDESLTGSDVQGKAQTSTVAAVNGTLTGYDVSGQPAIPALGQPFVDGSLTTWDINDATLAGRDVQDGSLTTSDVFDGTLAGRDVQNNSLTGEDINESTLAPVPSANPNADTLDGIDSTGFLRSTPPEAYREVGAKGQPPFGPGWSNGFVGGETTAAFFKDAFGIVHLKGVVRRSGGQNTIFTLPPGYQPSKTAIFPTMNVGQSPLGLGFIRIFNTGVVELTDGSEIGNFLLDGITFRSGAG